MGSIDFQRIHCCQDCGGEIVARGSFDKPALAVARIIECNGPPCHSEVI
jgi:hypothetical protein